MENLTNEMPSVDIYKKLRNDYYFMPFMKNLGFTENSIKAFEKKYYPELFEEKKKENVVKKPLIIRAWLKEFIDIYKRFNKEDFDILYVFCGKIDNGENPSFDELCKNLKIE